MPSSKIVNEQEVIDWIERGESYQWMVDQYLRKYNIETTISMWSNFRKRRALAPRIARDPDLIPWKVREEHGWATPLTLLRLEARRRNGFELRPVDQTRLDNWLKELEESGAVVHYDPDTADGFHYVPREPEDDDIIRRPSRQRDGGATSDTE
jgi:hypothetical protein